MTHILGSLTAPRTLFPTLLLALLAVGGAGTAHAFNSTSEYSWGVMNSSSIVLGKHTNSTCFLSGMAGNLHSEDSPGGYDGNGVGVTKGGSIAPNYYLDVYTTNRPLGGYARCVDTIAGRTYEQYWSTSNPTPIVLAAVTPTRRCYLTGAGAFSDFQGQRGFKTNTDYVRVKHDGKLWYLEGHQSGGAWATAECLDITEDQGYWLFQAGTGARKDFLTLDTGGVTCFLTGIGGHFDTNDWADGVFVSKAAGKFYLNTKNGKTGWVNCVK